MSPLLDESLERYAQAHSETLSDTLNELERYTRDSQQYAEMLVGPLEAALLRTLVRLTGARRILEIGTFTGYSALAMAEVLPDDGEITTCDVNHETTAVAQRFFDRSPHGAKISIRLGNAIDTLRSLEGPYDLVFLDADKENYLNYYELILPRLRTGGLLVADNVLWSGKVLAPEKDTDRALAAFNARLHADPQVDTVLLTVRDGVMLAVKR